MTQENAMTKSPLTLYLAAPRGFCAGVDRAIKIVEMALEKWGASFISSNDGGTPSRCIRL